MMKKASFSFCLFISMLGVLSANIGLIDSMKLEQCEFVRQFEEAMKQEKSKQEQQLIPLRSEVELLFQEINDPEKQEALSPEAKEEKMQLLEERQRLWQQKGQEIQQEMRKKYEDHQEELFEKVSSAAEKVSKERGLSYVLLKGAVLYYDENSVSDITDQVIKEVDRGM